MKRYILLSTLLLVAAVALAGQLVIGSYNIRLFVTSDEEKGEFWSIRCKVMCDQMNFESPDAFGAQEVTHKQLVDMLAMLDGYGYTGRARDDGNTEGEYSCIFYKKDRLRLLDEGTFAGACARGRSSRLARVASRSTCSTCTWITSAPPRGARVQSW